MIFRVSATLAFLAGIVSGEMKVELVKDIYPGLESSNPLWLTAYNELMYFSANNGLSGRELWVSDGTYEGTALIMDINPGPSSSNPSHLTEFQRSIYFRADDGLTGEEMWVTDGTPEGTRLFMDINQGAASSSPGNFVPLGPIMLFEATTVNAVTELWSTDGTVTGTHLVMDINPAETGSSLLLHKENTISDRYLIFTADDGINGEALWSTDGSAAGTILLKVVGGDVEGTNNIYISQQPKLQGTSKIFFGIGTELWVTDGTVSGTMLVKENVDVSGSSRISHSTIGGSTLFFASDETEAKDSLWQTDGTSVGTKVIFDQFSTQVTRGVSAVWGIGFGPLVNGKMSFVMDNGSGVNLWVTDGFSTILLVENSFDWVVGLSLQSNGQNVLYLVKNNDVIELWISNHEPGGTRKVYEFYGTDSTIATAAVLNDIEVLFQGIDGNGVELWKFTFPDSTAVNTNDGDIVNQGGDIGGGNFTDVGGRIVTDTGSNDIPIFVGAGSSASKVGNIVGFMLFGALAGAIIV